MASLISDTAPTDNLDWVDCLAREGYWFGSSLLTAEGYEQLVSAFEKKQPLLRQAHIGSIEKHAHPEVRGDQMLWLENGDTDFKLFFECLEQFAAIVRRELFLPINNVEVQMALYVPGQFYARHVDRHQRSTARLLSAVFYLNDWRKGDGGELVIYRSGKPDIVIHPQQNSIVIFDSKLEHEVLPTNRDRRSLTAWFRNDIC